MTFVRNTTLIPFSLWTTQGPETSVLTKVELPNFRAWLAQAKRVDVQVDRVQEPLLAALSPPHERAWALEVGWPAMDGCLPWAARAATERGLALNAANSGWAFISLCNWHVSNGQVSLGDPAHLQIDEATDAILFQAMQSFFAEDGIAKCCSTPMRSTTAVRSPSIQFGCMVRARCQKPRHQAHAMCLMRRVWPPSERRRYNKTWWVG